MQAFLSKPQIIKSQNVTERVKCNGRSTRDSRSNPDRREVSERGSSTGQSRRRGTFNRSDKEGDGTGV